MRTEPLKDLRDIEKLKSWLKKKKSCRDWCWTVLGLNTGLRISDILGCRWKNIYSFEEKRFKDKYLKDYNKVIIKEKKTEKYKRFPLNDTCISALKQWKEEYESKFGPIQPETYVFTSRQKATWKRSNYQKTEKVEYEDKPISTRRALDILKEAAVASGIKQNVGTHLLRKSFTFHQYKTFQVPLPQLMKLLNHSSEQQTLQYMGLDEEVMDELYINFSL